MLVGSGLLAKAFAQDFSKREDVCIYAAGVSNSGCVDPREFARERHRLCDALALAADLDRFVYFGTCSVADPEAAELPYVRHKLAMEDLVRGHRQYLILRLPQVAGSTPNPHTLLNYLYARISRSEQFKLWRKAKRNIIDIADVEAIACQIITDAVSAKSTHNIANPKSYSMIEIVGAMERIVGKTAIYDLLDKGTEYAIDISTTLPICRKTGVTFGSDYLEQIIGKYYPREHPIARRSSV